MTAESPAATTEAVSPEPDGEGPETPQGAESAPAVPDTDENRKAKEGFSTRIDELTRNWRESERREQALMDMLREQRQQAAPEVTQQRNEPGEPELKTLTDFAYDEKAYAKYVLDTARNAAKSETESLRREFRESQSKQSRDAARATFEERAQAFAKAEKVENFELAFKDPRDGGPTVTDAMAETIMDSEHGPALLNYLAKNRQESVQIARMTPLQQAREIGRLEAKLAKPIAPTVSGAPPPAPRIEGSSSGTVTVKADDPESDKKLSDAEWTRARERQLAARTAALNRK